MESENDHPRENASNNPSTDASDAIQPGIVEGLYILTNRKTRTLLDINGDNPASRTDVMGWERNTDHLLDHQLWDLKKVDSNGSYRLMTFRRGTYLDLEGGKQENNSQVFGYNYVGKVDARLHQEWIISEEPEGFYSLRCAKTGTFLEIHEGKPDNGIKVTCSKRVDGGDHQLWDLERATRTTIEIKSILRSWKPEILSRLFQPHDDKNEYFILPGNLRNTIWNGTKLQRQAVRKGSFDYDSFVIKAKDAVHIWARDRLLIDGYYVLFGIVFGQANKGPKAYNWYLSPDMQALVFFDAQTSKEYTTSGLEHFGFEPSFVMF